MIISEKSIFVRQKKFYFIFDLIIIKKIKILQIKSFFFLLLEFLPNRTTSRNLDQNFSFLGEIFFQIKKKADLFQIFEQVKKFKKFKKFEKNLRKRFLFYEKSKENINSKFNIPYLSNLNTKPCFLGNKKTQISVCLLENSLYFNDKGNKNFQEINLKLLICIFFQENKKLGHFLILLEFSEFPEFLVPIKKLKIQLYFENCSGNEKLIKKKKKFIDTSNSDEDFHENLKNEKISKNFGFFVFFLRKISGKNIQKTNDFLSFWGIKEKKNLFFSITRRSLISFDLWPPLILDFCDIEILYMERNFSGARSFDLVFILNQNEKPQKGNNYSWIRILSIENKKFGLVQKLSKFHKIKFLSGPLSINWNLTLKIISREFKKSFEKKFWEFLTNDEDSDRFTDQEDELYKPDNLNYLNEFNSTAIEDDRKEENLDWEDLVKSIE